MLDNWNHYVDEFIQVVPIEYKLSIKEEQMRKLQQKIADVQKRLLIISHKLSTKIQQRYGNPKHF